MFVSKTIRGKSIMIGNCERRHWGAKLTRFTGGDWDFCFMLWKDRLGFYVNVTREL